ncbi:type VII secretion target [Mycobacterium sp. 050272]|uniref:type VII secretion target n=1 Tax=Mycobacterium sp. 050272 TaxID=3142488 RepID=UPI00318F73B0
MDGLRVTPEELTALKNELGEAKKAIDAGFNAPEHVGGYPDKIEDTHGFSSRIAVYRMLEVLSNNRADVHTKMTAAITDLQASLQAASAMYRNTDESHAGVLKQQVDTNG